MRYIKITIYTAIFLSAFAMAHSASAATNVYYSVGQDGATDRKTGTPTVTVSGTTATFSEAQIGNIGVGDVVTYNTNDKCYISGKTSQTVWSCVSNTGGNPPAAAAGTTVNSIKRVYTSLAAAVNSAGGANVLLGTADLTSNGGYILNFPCYYDTGADINGTEVAGWTTDATQYIKIYTPNNTSNEVNVSQRHSGKWDNNKYRLEANNPYGFVNIADSFVRIDGLQIKINSSYIWNIGLYIYSAAGSKIYISNNIIARNIATRGYNYGIYISMEDATATAYIWNNLIYNWTGEFNAAYATNSGTNYAYNNTVYNSTAGYSNSATFISKNNIAQACTDGFNGTFDVSSDYNISNVNAADSPGANSQNNVSVGFVSTTAGSEDFHLLSTDTIAKDKGANLASDANLPLNRDIDDQIRGVKWDIGADEYVLAQTNASTVGVGGTATVNSSLVGTMPNNLLVHYTFDAPDMDFISATKVATDKSGNGNNGTWAAAGTPIGPSMGKFGQAANWTNTKQITIPNSPISGNVILSISLWFKTTSYGPLVGYSDSNAGFPTCSSACGPIMYVGDDGKLRAQFLTSPMPNPATPITSAAAVNDGVWHHAVLVGNTNTQSLYLDGNSTPIGTLSGTINQSGAIYNFIGYGPDVAIVPPGIWPLWPQTSNNNITPGFGYYYYLGSIDDFRLYNKALSATEVGDLYRMGQATIIKN